MHTATRSTPSATGRVLWVPVESGLIVGNRNGDYLGSIEPVKNGFVAVDGRGQAVGLFAELSEAKKALDGRTGLPAAHRRERVERVARAAAAGAGVVAATLALTAGALAPVL